MAVAIRVGREAIAGMIMHTDQGSPPSPESVKEASTPDLRIVPTCCRGSPTAQAISLSGRHNHEVGTIGVMPRSALRRLCATARDAISPDAPMFCADHMPPSPPGGRPVRGSAKR
jgi:hypothetical protein